MEFPMKRLLSIGLLCTLFFAAQVRATPILTGDVSFDDVTHLYTYTYTLDTTQNSNIRFLGILQNLESNFYEPLPYSHTQPDGWNFGITAGGVKVPGEIFGSFWTWEKFASIDNSNLLTFSFTTHRGINSTQEDNYLMFDPYGTSGPPAFPGIIVGKIIGPEFVSIEEVPVTPVPENETYAMMMTGLALLGFVARRKTKQEKVLEARAGVEPA
jgi:hypothetical protein